MNTILKKSLIQALITVSAALLVWLMFGFVQCDFNVTHYNEYARSTMLIFWLTIMICASPWHWVNKD